MTTIREAFEEWYSEGGAYPNAIKCRTAGGEYLLAQAATSWNVWQAAHSSRDEEVRILREAVEAIDKHPTNGNSEPDSMAEALDQIHALAEAAIEALKIEKGE